MTTQEIQNAVLQLSDGEFRALLDWMLDLEAERGEPKMERRSGNGQAGPKESGESRMLQLELMIKRLLDAP